MEYTSLVSAATFVVPALAVSVEFVVDPASSTTSSAAVVGFYFGSSRSQLDGP